MFMIQPIEFAPEFVKNIAQAATIEPSAYAIIQMYNADATKYPNLRDRTNEMIAAVAGMGGKSPADVVILNYTGSEMHREFNFDAVGAQFAANYRIIFV